MSTANTAAGFISGTGFSSQCFPVRSLTRRHRQDEDGAWLVAYRAEQRRRFKAVLCSGEPSVPTQTVVVTKFKEEESETIEDEKRPKLDGFYLMKQFHVDDPSDLCSIKISGRELREVNENDFLLFDNVIHVDAGDNNLPFSAFSKFSALQELELPLNNICNSIKVQPDMFECLMTLDLSYNRLSGGDILALGLLRSLRTLHLTGNELRKLPVEMTRTYRTITGMTPSGTVESQERRQRFTALENLYLDHNELTDLSTFASLAGLKKLKYLNLEHNEISSIPHLRLLGARVREDDMSRQENTKTVESSLPDVLEENEKEMQKEKGFSQDKKESKGDEDNENVNEFILNDEVDDMLSQNLVDHEQGEERNRPEIKPSSSTLTEDPSLLGDRYNPPLPFNSLLHLNLANNLIFEEEGLLALMSWPSLRELVVWGNPLTTAFKGDPPVLSFQLGRLKGVRIFRQKPPKRPKPTVNLANTHRKVKDTLPPMPKKQNLAMLEAPPEPKSIAYVGPPYKTLPPIGSAPPTGRQRQSTTPRKLYTAPCATEKTPRDERPPFDRTNSMPPDEFSESAQYQSGHTTRQTVKTDGEATVGESVGTADGRHQPRAGERLNTDDGFFMTQIDEQGDEQSVEAPKRKPKKEKERPFSVETKYKGYEDLFDVDAEDPDIVIPKDLQGSVRALKYALAHPLIFSEPHGRYHERRAKKIKTVSTSTGSKSRQSKVEELGGILDKMRVQSKTKESNLETALQDFKKDPKMKQQYREAKKLLNEVQTKYNEVRVASLRPTATAQELFGSRAEPQAKETDIPNDSTQVGTAKLGRDKNIAKELKRFKEKIDSRL